MMNLIETPPRKSDGSIATLLVTGRFDEFVFQRIAALFDEKFYRTQNGDIEADRSQALIHYLEIGWREGRNPSQFFNTKYYLESNPDVRAANICPLVHYAMLGAAEGRWPSPKPEFDSDRRKISGFFDAEFYRSRYPDTANVPDCLAHYLEAGWREGRNPSAIFDTQYYLEVNPDVRAAGLCPLVHYAKHGLLEGRRTRRPVPPARIIINQAASPREISRGWIRPQPDDSLTVAALHRTLQKVASKSGKGLTVALSHDDYTTNLGGVQNCVGDEQSALVAAGWHYLHLCPVQPLPMLSDEVVATAFFVSLRLDGESIGTARLSDVAGVLNSLRRADQFLYLVVHHLMGFSPEAVTEFAQALQPTESVVWLHDFFTLCVSYALLRNNVAFCHGPELESQACGVCCFGGERRTHRARIDAMLKDLDPVVVAPSHAALDFWGARTRVVPRKTHVLPHASLVLDPILPLPEPSHPLRVGFLGAPIHLKGWTTFEALAAKHYGGRYAFYHLGYRKAEEASNIKFVEVIVDRANRDAMVRAVEQNALDVVINWSLCYETFSFTTYEALAAGAYVIARRDAGNVWPAVEKTGASSGCALDTDEDLFEMFETGLILELATASRGGRLMLNAGTTTYLLEAALNV